MMSTVASADMMGLRIQMEANWLTRFQEASLRWRNR